MPPNTVNAVTLAAAYVSVEMQAAVLPFPPFTPTDWSISNRTVTSVRPGPTGEIRVYYTGAIATGETASFPASTRIRSVFGQPFAGKIGFTL